MACPVLEGSTTAPSCHACQPPMEKQYRVLSCAPAQVPGFLFPLRGNLPEAWILSYTGRPTKKTHRTGGWRVRGLERLRKKRSCRADPSTPLKARDRGSTFNLRLTRFVVAALA